MDTDFLLGVNYWPPNLAMQWWKRFDDASLDSDFAQIAEYGMQAVRFFLLWEDFQPVPDHIDSSRLKELVTVMDRLHAHQLQGVPTLLVGNMSGVMWFPEWSFSGEPEQSAMKQIANGHSIDRELRSPFQDSGMLLAEARLASEAASCIAGHPALHSWDIANEIDQAALPADPEIGRLWTQNAVRGIRAGDASTPITYGAHSLSLTTRGLTLPAISPSLDYPSMHGYPIYNDEARGPLDTEWVPFLTTLTAALGEKPALMQEFGLPTTRPGEPSHTIQDDFLGVSKPQFLSSEEDAGEYYSAVLDRLWQTGAAGAMAWIYADYAEGLWSEPPLKDAKRERTFGLFRADRSPKPPAEVIQRFAREIAAGELVQRLGPHGSQSVALEIDPNSYYVNPSDALGSAFEQYLGKLNAK